MRASERVFNAVTLSGCHQHLIISISNGGNTLTIIFSAFLDFNSFLGSSGLVCFHFPLNEHMFVCLSNDHIILTSDIFGHGGKIRKEKRRRHIV